MKIEPQSKLMHAILNADRVFKGIIDGSYTLTTDGGVFRLGHGEDHWLWKGHNRVAFVVKQGDEWHDLLEGHDAGTTP